MGARIQEQKFEIQHPQNGQVLELVNLIGKWHRERPQRIVIGAHYDTRPHPDEETEPDRQELPSSVRNDGASGVALEMEIAHHLKDLDTRWGVDLVLFDGEDWCSARLRTSTSISAARRSSHAATWSTQDATRSRYVYGIVLDMVAGKNIQIKKEPKSVEFH